MAEPTRRALLLRANFVKGFMLMLLGVVGVGIGIRSGRPIWKQSVGWLIVAGCFSAAAVYGYRLVILFFEKDADAARGRELPPRDRSS